MATSLFEKQFRLISDEVRPIGHSRSRRPPLTRQPSRKTSRLDEAGREKLLEKLVTNHLERTFPVQPEVIETLNDDPGVGPVTTSRERKISTNKKAQGRHGISRDLKRMISFSQSVPTLAEGAKKRDKRRVSLSQAVSEDNLAARSRRLRRTKTDMDISWARLPSIYLKSGDVDELNQTGVAPRRRKMGSLAPFAIPELPETENKSRASTNKKLASAKSSRTVDSGFSLEDNWILRKENEERMKRMERTFAKLMIPIPEDDFPDIVERRFKEMAEMTRPVIRPHSIFDQLDDVTKERVLRMINVGPDDFKKMRRKGWKKPNLFQYAGRMALVVTRACNARKRYLRESVDGAPNVGKGNKRMSDITSNKGTTAKSSLGWDMSLSLYTRPEFRTDSHLKKIIWILRATRAFTHLFPAEMEQECAREVCYGRYDDGRLIGHQGRAPDWFYYVISGKIQKLRQYDLTSGMVTKSLGTISKDMTTNPEELEKGIPRECNLVAKGSVEVLILHKSAFEELLQTNEGPPIDYLRTLELFEAFPIDEFLNHQESIEYKYYGENKVIVKDTNRTPWLHVVKSGQIKVVRRQDVVDTQGDQEAFERQETDALGCSKFPSHANAMLGYSYKQKKNHENQKKSLISLPQISNTQTDLVSNPLGHTLGVDEPHITLQTIGEEDVDNLTEVSEEDQISRSTSLVTQSVVGQHEEPQIIVSSESVPSSDSEEDAPEETKSETEYVGMTVDGENSELLNKHLAPLAIGMKMKRLRKESSALPLINIAMRETDESDFNPHPFYLTREKTGASSVMLPKANVEKEKPERRALLQLGALKAGDVFGLDTIFYGTDKDREGLEHMEAPVASEGAGYSLISDGAEVIRISKRFFLQNAKNNTMLKVDTLHKHYLDKEDAKTALYQQEVWSKYKSVLMQRIVKKVLQKQSPKHKKPKSQMDAPLGHTPRPLGSEVLAVSHTPRK